MNYWAYARVSTRKQARGHTIGEQIRPLAKFLRNHGYTSQNSIRTHLFHEQYTGTTMKRPKFQQMMKLVQPGDELVFAKLSRMSRTLDGADKFIVDVCEPNNIKVHILDGGWNIDPTTAMGRLQMHLFLSFVEFDHDMIIERMNEGRRQAKLSGKHNWNGGIAPRFFGKKRKYYTKVFQYAENHSERETATTFDISTRTVTRIKRSGEAYFSLPKTTRIKFKTKRENAKLGHKLDLQKRLEAERDDLVMDSKDLSLLKLKNRPLYERRHKEQSKARANIRKEIKRTKKELKKLEK